jgi:integrase
MDERAELCGTALAADAFVFSLTADGSAPMRPEYLTRPIRQLRRRLGLEATDFDATLHALRHWTQTALAEAGYNARQVAIRGGHSQQLMERVYVHRTAHIEREMTAHIGQLLTQGH